MGYGAPGLEAIGPIANLAPSPGPGRARVLGLPQAMRLAGNIGGPLAEAMVNRFKAAKDFNDDPADRVDGAAAGRLVTAAPEAAAAL